MAVQVVQPLHQLLDVDLDLQQRLVLKGETYFSPSTYFPALLPPTELPSNSEPETVVPQGRLHAKPHRPLWLGDFSGPEVG